jgi:hypothetical protein
MSAKKSEHDYPFELGMADSAKIGDMRKFVATLVVLALLVCGPILGAILSFFFYAFDIEGAVRICECLLVLIGVAVSLRDVPSKHWQA